MQPTCLGVASANGFDFVVTPIAHPRHEAQEEIDEPSTLKDSSKNCLDAPAAPRQFAFTRSDLILNSSDWSTLIVASLSRRSHLESGEQRVRRRSEEALRRELQFCAHLGLSAVMLRLNRAENANLARLVYAFLIRNGNGPQIWVRAPMNNEPCLSDGEGEDFGDTWEWWDAFRSSANYEKKLSLALEVGNGRTHRCSEWPW